MAFEKGIESAVRVGVAQFHLGYAPVRMMTMALGSCIGIVLHDSSAGVGALAHAMLPRCERVKNNANRAKFVDTVIPILMKQMIRRGARQDRIVAKLFGGARMFDTFKECKGVLQIGDENIVTAREVLAKLGIPVVGECVGGTSGRTIIFNVADGSVRVRYVDNTEELL